MSMVVIKSGVADTLQDLGRFSYRHRGVNVSGAMDKYAMQISNALTGNELQEAVIEMCYPPSTFLFTKPACIALAGADFSPMLNGEPVPLHQPFLVAKDDILHFEKHKKGNWCYLSVSGGIKGDYWLGSCSTHLKIKKGGYQGRTLRKGDEIFFKTTITFHTTYKNRKILPWYANPDGENGCADLSFLYLLKGCEWETLSDESKDALLSKPFTLSPKSDRMGYTLQGPVLESSLLEEQVSSAVDFGTIQLLPGGQAIVLMADHQTTGGFPRIAHVISAHHSRLAQWKAGDPFYFKLTDIKTAEALFFQQQNHLNKLRHACLLRLQEIYSYEN
ncbi:MAG: biotin-dependent carboxyltransferase family protein [Chitinophagaceae bacterium]|nr:biotin-dependent carboxyltransferase family protein [Chitinophagaceae bacterium]